MISAKDFVHEQDSTLTKKFSRRRPSNHGLTNFTKTIWTIFAITFGRLRCRKFLKEL